MKSIRLTTSEEKIAQSLLHNCRYFTDTLGNPTREGKSLVFHGVSPHPSDFRVHYIEQSKFLGKFYIMVAEATMTPRKFPATPQRAELCFSGTFTKAKPFFRPIKISGEKVPSNSKLLIDLLNSDESILMACRKIDLEFLRVSFDEQSRVWRIQISPYGGSFIWISFPPLRYNVVLPRAQAEVIVSLAKRIGQLIIERFPQ